MPRNYEIKDEDDEEEDEKKDDKNVEAVIDLTEDDDAPVVTSETLDKKDGPSMHTWRYPLKCYYCNLGHVNKVDQLVRGK